MAKWPTFNGVVCVGNNSPLINAPAYGASVLTASDTTTYDPPLRGLYIGGTGNANILLPDGSTVLFSALPVGTILPVLVVSLMATNTTATLVVGMR